MTFVATLAQAAPLLDAADDADAAVWPGVVLAGLVVLAVLGVLHGAGAFGSGVLRRGPERWLDLTVADRVIGLGLVAMMLIGSVLATREAWVQAGGVLSSLGLIGGTVFFLMKAWMSPAGLRAAGLLPRRPLRDLSAGVLGAVVGTLLTWGTLALVAAAAGAAGSPPPRVNHTLLEALGDDPSGAALQRLVLVAVVVGPLLEEIVFRGLMQTTLIDVLGRGARWTAVGITAVVFALIHASAVSWHGWPGLFVLALVLGWLYERTGSLLPCYLTHALFNAANVAAAVWVWPPAAV